MPIIRQKPDRSNFWRAIPSRTGEDQRLSLPARGLLFYLLVKPDNWEIKTQDLLRAGSASTKLNKSRKPRKEDQNRRMGEKTLRALIEELEEAGYLTRTQIKTPKGLKWIITVFDSP